MHADVNGARVVAQRRSLGLDAKRLTKGAIVADVLEGTAGMNAIVTEAVTGKLRPDAAAKARRFGGRTRYLWNLFTAINNTRMRERGKFVFL